jgi:3-dehydroquinate dehydratase II
MSVSVMVINGPNLNRLGTREPEIYGTATLADLEAQCQDLATALGFSLDFRQSNSEADCITWLHEAADTCAGVIFNPAAFTHYSYAVGDACALLQIPIVEVHLSNPASREEFRKTSVVAPYVTGTIAGFGIESYRLALRALAEQISASR